MHKHSCFLFVEFLQVMTGKNFYDLTFNRQFVFAAKAPSRHCWTPTCRARDCPTRRLRLHRRIEWHFERLFEQMWRPLHAWHRPLNALSCSSVACDVKPALANTSRHTAVNVQNETTTIANKRNVKFTQTTDVQTESEIEIPPPQSCSGCYHSTFRPRFPKWVPIFTLYRELVQNPFRRRSRLMITHN